MLAELGSRLMVADNSTLFTSARKANLIKDAHLWATSYKEWPELVRAKTTTTTTDEYYDYPDEFRTDSVIRLIINSNKYDKKNYEDFLDYLDEHSDNLDSYTAGLTMDVYGSIQPEELTDTSIFSQSDDSGNEAIVKKALSVALKKSSPQVAIQEEAEAKIILDNIWKRIALRQQREERLDHPFFNVPDFLGKTNKFTVTNPVYIFADYQRKIFVASFS